MFSHPLHILLTRSNKMWWGDIRLERILSVPENSEHFFLHTWRTRATVKGAHGVQTLHHGRTGATAIIGQAFIHILTTVAVSMPTWRINRRVGSDSNIHLEHPHELLPRTVGTFHRWMAHSIYYFFLLYRLFRDFLGNYVILILVKRTFFDQTKVLHWNTESNL